MKASNANKVISVLLSVAMCPMMVPTAAFAADDGTASGASTAVEQAQPADQAEASGTGASSGNTLAAQSEAAEAATGEAATGEAAAPAAAPAAEAAGETAGEEAAPAVTATINGYSTLEEAVQNATVDEGVITYEVTGKVNVDSTGWVQVRPTAATNAKVVKFVGKSADAEICITQGVAILADQRSSALSVEFSDLKLSKQNPKYVGDYGWGTEYFSTWLRNTDAASNCVTYTKCEFPNGVCNNQYGKTVFNSCKFTNTITGFYNMWVYGGNVEVKGGSFTGVRGVKVYTEGTAEVAPKVAISGASFSDLSEKAAVVVSKPAAVTLDNVAATDCAKGLIQKDIEGSSEKVTLDANGTGIGGKFDITEKTGSDATKAEFNLNAGTLTSEVPSDFLADGFTLSKSSDGTTFGVAEAAPAGVAEVNGKSYSSLQAAIDAAPRNATVKLLADTKENVAISANAITLDLNGYTLNGSTGERKPALTINAVRVTVQDSSEAQTGTIMREDTAENSGVSSHYVIDLQGKNGFLLFNSGTVKNNSGAGGTKGASLVRIGSDSNKKAHPVMTIAGGTFTQDNFIAIKVDFGTLYVKGGVVNSKNSYAIENWLNANIKDNAVINGNVSSWTYAEGSNSNLNISGGTVNGNVESVTYDGAEGKTAKVSITGGIINGTLSASKYNSTEINDPTKATIEVTGGTFSTDPSRYLIEGSAATPNADGTYGVAKAYLAQVGETSYYTMDEAFKAQTASGEAITLLRDYTTGSTFNSGTVARVVDLNGHTWTCTGTDANSAAFEINNPNASLTVKNGKIVSSQLIGLIPSAMGGTIKYDNSILTFEGVEATTTATSGIETNGNNTNDAVVLKNSTLDVPNGFGIYFPSSGTLTIDNSRINAKTMGAQVCSGSLNVTAGSAITVSGDPVEKLEGDGAIQDGAAISIVNRAGYKGLGKIAITGGTFTAKVGNAALKAYTWDSSTKQESAFDNSAKTVAVSGGTFSSAVASDLCAEGYAPVKNEDGTYSVGVPVAQIGGTVFTSLQAAIDAAQAGDTVQLIADAVVDATVVVQGKGAITLDLNGKTISNTKEIWNEDINNWSLVSVRGNSDLTITGNGAIDALANDSYAIDLQDAASKCTIENGTFTGNISAVYIFDGALTINGGTFDIKQLSSGQDGRRFTINCYDSSYKNGTAQVSINGGTFNGFDPANNLAEGTGTTFTAPGYTSVANADGTYGVVAGVAQVGTKVFAGLQAAINAAQDGDTVQLLTDIVLDAQAGTESGLYPQFTISGKKLTLDMQGHKISYSEESRTKDYGKASLLTLSINNGSDVTITGNGTIDTELGSNQAYGINILGGSNLTIDNGTFYGAMTAVQVQKGGLVINDGTFLMSPTCKEQVPEYAKYIINCIDAAWKDGSATVSIKGGTFGHDYSHSPEGEGTSYLAPGYAPTANADGTYGVVAGVAQIGTKAYATLADAVAAAQDGETVTLLADATEDVVINKNITLDLGGKTLTNTNAGEATISVQGGTVTVKNGNVVGGTSYYNIEVTKGSNANLTLTDVTATAGNTDSSMIDNYGTLTVTSGTYTGGLDTVKNEPNAKLAITGGAFTLTKGTSKGFTGVVFNYGELTISGGEFVQSDKSARYGQAQVIHTDKSGSTVPSTVISGGTFKNLCTNSVAWAVRATNAAAGATQVSGGTFNKSISEGYCADGFIPTKNADGTYGVKEGHYVAQVGSKKYETLADAIRLAAKGKTITLLTDVEQNSQLTIGKNITLDLNGKIIKNTVDIWGDKANAILSITNGAKVTITGDGTIDAKENDCYTINVVKGDLTIENGTFYGNVSVVQVQEGTLSVKGGSFDLHQKWDGSSKYLFNCIDDAYASGSAKVAISGGTFVGFDPSASPEGEGTSYLAPGYAPTDNGDGTYGVVAGAAQIGTKAYASLQAAIDAAQAGETVALLTDTTENVTIAATKQITLDLNGYTLNGGTGNTNATILNKGTLTITDTSAGKTGAIKRDDQGIEGETSYYVIRNIGTMVIDQANVVNNSGYPKANSSGSMVGSSLICNGDDDPQASLTINGGTFTQPNFLVVKNGSNGTLTVNGGTLTSNHSAVQNWNKAQILGGSLTGQIWTDAWVEGAIGETVIGGDAQFTGEIVVDITGKVPPTLKIEGGKLDVTKWRVTSAAAKANATVAVSGGTFTAAVPENYCAAGYVPATNANGTYGVAVGKFTVQVTSRTTTSDSPVANVSGGGSDITYAEGTTVTASAISGYKFVGWFVNEYAGAPYNTDLTCTVKPTDNCTMIAVYEPVSGGKFWLTVAASEFTVNGGAVQDSYLYEQYAIGASVTVNFTGSENFLYWVNASNKVVSTDKSYTFTMGSETALKAVYGKARQNQATVVFVSHSDQIISSKAYTTNETLQFPVPPIKMGCTFTGWSMTEDQIHAAMASNGGIIEVRALYTEPSMACKVTVVYPEGVDNEDVDAVVGKAIDVTAKDIDGKTFSYWTDNDGNILGYTKTLKLAPSGDMTVKAIYSDGATEAQPVISISEVSATKVNEGYAVTFMATRAIPEGYQVVEQGILWSRDAACGEDGAATYMQFDSNGKLPTGVNAYIGNSLELNGVTRLDISTKYSDRTFYGRGYMILKSDAGELLYIYTDTIASGSYDSLTK